MTPPSEIFYDPPLAPKSLLTYAMKPMWFTVDIFLIFKFVKGLSPRLNQDVTEHIDFGNEVC